MLLPEAIKLRIIELLDINNLSAYKLSYKGGISPSNISDVLRGKVTEPTISTILHICKCANINLKDFFVSKLFDEVETVERNKKDIKKNNIKSRYIITIYLFFALITELILILNK